MRVVLANSHEEVQRERQLVHDFASRRLDGVIVVPAGSDHAHLAPDQLGGIPVVLAASQPSNVDLDAVVLDDFGGTRRAVGALTARGHERIGFLGLPASTWTGSERFRGYCAALDEIGRQPENRYVHRHQPDVGAAERIARRLLDLRDPPTALFAANNRNTIGAYRAIRARGSSAELSGFDDFELADSLSIPLSLVAYDPRELGRQAARLLCDRLDPAAPKVPFAARRIVVPTNLVTYGGGA
jgi:LacI family transcriptional regulator